MAPTHIHWRRFSAAEARAVCRRLRIPFWLTVAYETPLDAVPDGPALEELRALERAGRLELRTKPPETKKKPTKTNGNEDITAGTPAPAPSEAKRVTPPGRRKRPRLPGHANKGI